VLVSDENVGAVYAGPASESLCRAGFSTRTVLIPAGEQHKTIDTVIRLWEGFLEAGLERGGPVVALGGGVVGDLAGFAAATYKRGVPWIAVPTSLLAMADASLGGKTGADLPQGKNLVGAFHPPQLVLADPQALNTLPEGELRSGMAEVVKAGIIDDPQLFELCAQGWQAVEADWAGIVRRAMAVKVDAIQADPYEKGRRAALNLGHTFGHALETVTGYRIRHGEAVSIGMVLAARLSERLGLAQPGLAEVISSALMGLGLTVEIPDGIDLQAMDLAMRVDKKRSQGVTRFVLPRAVGDVVVGVEVGDWRKVISDK
jgi:3-dehydroquinate synthase